VLGAREVEQGTVALRARGAGNKQENMSQDAFEARLKAEIASRSLVLGKTE